MQARVFPKGVWLVFSLVTWTSCRIRASNLNNFLYYTFCRSEGNAGALPGPAWSSKIVMLEYALHLSLQICYQAGRVKRLMLHAFSVNLLEYILPVSIFPGEETEKLWHLLATFAKKAVPLFYL